MDPIVASHAQILAVNHSLIARAVAGIPSDDLTRQPGPQSNSMHWLLGHLALTRSGVAGLLGDPSPRPSWAPLFARGSDGVAVADYPPVAELLASLEASTEVIKTLLAALTDEAWSAPSPRPFPIPDKTMRGALAFIQFHETYHVGQLAYLRKWLGHSALVG